MPFTNEKPIYLTDHSKVMALGQGTVKLEAYINKKWIPVTIENVLHVPSAMNLFSESRAAKKGYLIVRDDKVTNFYKDGSKPGPVAVNYSNSYYMKFRPLKEHMQAHACRKVTIENEDDNGLADGLMVPCKQQSEHPPASPASKPPPLASTTQPPPYEANNADNVPKIVAERKEDARQENQQHNNGENPTSPRNMTIIIHTNNGEYTAVIPTNAKSKVIIPKPTPPPKPPMTLRERSSLKQPDRYQACMTTPDAAKPTANKSTAGYIMPIWTTLLLMFAFLTLGNGYDLQNSVPLLWRRGSTPVTSGHYQVNLLIKFVSPCSILENGAVHRDLTESAVKKCKEIYTELFLDELEVMCPRTKWTDVLERERRAIFTLFVLGIIAVVQVVAAGLGVAAFAVSVSNTHTIADVKQAVEQQKQLMKEMDERVTANTEKLELLQRKFNEAIIDFQKLSDDVTEIKGTSITTNYAISYITIAV
ncbi:unnamed protein product [Orchesella dallaii]|uniref:Retrovirus-related Pol polyprotein from transposon TNT 1-94-like beta-barrel domain-containing protein n=1 Tax=Orchesella dallaii TaxID=48710 RepID=A0ABP1QHA4_9HEXA